jgi:predicted outer membrane repeat protein
MVLDVSGFTGNKSAQSGGAVYESSADSSDTLTVRNNTVFNSNQVTGSGQHRTFFQGGAIYTTDILNVTGGNFTGNSTTDDGGAIAYDPPLNRSSSMSVANVTFTGNSANDGGAVVSDVNINAGTVTVSVTGCLFNGNKALAPTDQNGGALWVHHTTSGTGSASLAVSNSTFYKNTAGNDGGALFLQNSNTGTGTNTAAVTSLTVNQNSAATAGGGVWIDPGMIAGLKVQFWNRIVAGNTINNPANDGPDVFGMGTVKTLENNLIGIIDGSDGWDGNDYTGGGTNPPLDPGLDPNGPTDNGGLTYTIKLVSGSQVYHHGAAALAGNADQRGYIRHAPVSIGAYDPDGTPPPP